MTKRPGDNKWLSREDILGRVVSFAQNGEDILLRRVFGSDFTGFYVDLGANDPVFHSVTKLLYDQGWHGLNVEPTPTLYEKLAASRPRDVNLNVGVSDCATNLTFFEVPAPLHGWSTFLPEMAESYTRQGVNFTEKKIPVVTLNQIFSEHIRQHVDVLKIDIEGFERKVIDSFDMTKYRPTVMLVEATWKETWERKILDNAFQFAAFDGINNYYVREENSDLLSAFQTPVNALDNYVSYEYLRLLQEDKALGPTVLQVAERLQHLVEKHPRSARFLKKLGSRWV